MTATETEQKVLLLARSLLQVMVTKTGIAKEQLNATVFLCWLQSKYDELAADEALAKEHGLSPEDYLRLLQLIVANPVFSTNARSLWPQLLWPEPPHVSYRNVLSMSLLQQEGDRWQVFVTGTPSIREQLVRQTQHLQRAMLDPAQTPEEIQHIQQTLQQLAEVAPEVASLKTIGQIWGQTQSLPYHLLESSFAIATSLDRLPTVAINSDAAKEVLWHLRQPLTVGENEANAPRDETKQLLLFLIGMVEFLQDPQRLVQNTAPQG